MHSPTACDHRRGNDTVRHRVRRVDARMDELPEAWGVHRFHAAWHLRSRP